ncbi:MAG: hypothetical protein KGI06_01610 [Candidatus Micrarchaeota archaeon]|nr:hypothetical protein [Candidatus Micrarchaeota archaeon]
MEDATAAPAKKTRLYHIVSISGSSIEAEGRSYYGSIAKLSRLVRKSERRGISIRSSSTVSFVKGGININGIPVESAAELMRLARSESIRIDAYNTRPRLGERLAGMLSGFIKRASSSEFKEHMRDQMKSG